MSQELIYTSVPRGLRPGSSGFCTVAMTAQMPPSLVERLESLSAYRPVFQLGDPQAAKNPVNWAYWRVQVRDTSYSVISRVSFAEADYTGRSNKFAHHLVVDPDERPRAGPAWALEQMSGNGTIARAWTGEPRLLEPGRAKVPAGDQSARRCTAWEAAAGDAGWAGILADSFRADPAKTAHLIYTPGMEMLPLIEEALALLPPALRWQVTFSTYFTDLPMGATCAWRCVVADSPAAENALRSGARPLIIDLSRPLQRAVGAAADAARAGRSLEPPSALPSAAAPPKKSIGQILPMKEDEPLELVERPAPSGQLAAARGQKRLQAQSALFIEEEPDSLSADDVVTQRRPMPAAAPARRGAPASMVFAIALVCLAIGGGAGYFFELRKSQKDKQSSLDAQFSELTGAAEEKLGESNQKYIDEKNALDSMGPKLARAQTDASEQKQQLEQYKLLHPEKAQTSTVSGSQSADTVDHSHSTPEKNLTADNSPKSGPGHTSQTPATTPSQTATAANPQAESQKIPDLPKKWIFDHETKLLEINDPKKETSQSLGIEGSFVKILFPNGSTEYKINNDGTAIITVREERGAAVVDLVTTDGDLKTKTIASFDFVGGKLTLNWKDVSFFYPKSGPAVFALLKRSAIFVWRNGEWSRFAGNTAVSKTEMKLFGKSGSSDVPGTDEFTATDLSPVIVIPNQEHRIPGWIAKDASIAPEDGAERELQPIDFTLSDAKRGVLLKIKNPNVGVIEDYATRLKNYGNKRGRSLPSDDQAIRVALVSDRDNGDGKPKDEIRSLLKTLDKVDELKKLDGLEVQIRLRNGILITQITCKYP